MNEFTLTFTFALRWVKRQEPPADQADGVRWNGIRTWALLDATSGTGINPGSSSPRPLGVKPARPLSYSNAIIDGSGWTLSSHPSHFVAGSFRSGPHSIPLRISLRSPASRIADSPRKFLLNARRLSLISSILPAQVGKLRLSPFIQFVERAA
jgi:hypothetical protein